MIDPTSADAYYADWNGRTVIRDAAPPVPEVTVLTPVTLTDTEREAINGAIGYSAETCPPNGKPATEYVTDRWGQEVRARVHDAVERIIAARLLEQATR